MDFKKTFHLLLFMFQVTMMIVYNIIWKFMILLLLEPAQLDVSVPRENSGRAYNNNSHLINRGKGLGGSSMLNFNMYLRGSPYDFQDWARITGDEGWNYGNVLPFFKRIEDYHGIFFNDNFHGHYGPLPVETGKDVPLRKEWLAAGAEMGLMLRDPNGFQSEGKVFILLQWARLPIPSHKA
ncbi:unnamed protein product [Allacma fusca]|uniref:Glucose-methanol-choline oxidoreductase N-terminal domain-containing protein n=1 Tax=Allacma fusca TaxID=39272 RepID=A0A8J2K8A4_9HEXA|nr:unnamed protein product [Allacma fusca]